MEHKTKESRQKQIQNYCLSSIQKYYDAIKNNLQVHKAMK